MKSNTRQTQTSQFSVVISEILPKCNQLCQLDVSCVSFNHNANSLACELNRDLSTDDGLQEAQGWNFYSINKTPSGKVCVIGLITLTAERVKPI